MNCGDEVGSPHRRRLDAFVTKNYERLGYICKKHGRAKGQDILDYIVGMQATPSLSATDRFLVQRLETLAKRLATVR